MRAQARREEGDSNPRASHPASGFQDRRLRPLGHPPAGSLPAGLYVESQVVRVPGTERGPEQLPKIAQDGPGDQGGCVSLVPARRHTCLAGATYGKNSYAAWGRQFGFSLLSLYRATSARKENSAINR